MFERIIVPLDGSFNAETVLPYVGEIASRFGSRIVLTRVNSSYDSTLVSEARNYLKEVSGRVERQLENWQARTETEVRFELRTGIVVNEILDYAAETACDFIAMSSRGTSGEGSWPLGSVAAKVLQASSFPVLVVRKPAGDTAVSQRKLLKKILVPLDGSKLGEAAIPFAQTLAKMLEAKIVLFRVVELSKYSVAAMSVAEMSYVTTYQYEKIVEPPVLSYLNSVKESVEKIAPDVAIAISEGAVADQIIDYAEANSVDLIAMSTHGRSGIGRWVFGSVTAKVLHAGGTPVLVVPPRRM